MVSISSAATDHAPLKRPPMMSGGGGLLGHALEFAKDPDGLMERGYREHGPVFSFRLGIRTFDVLIGPEFNKLFWEQTDKALDMARGMQFLRPLFSKKFWIWAGHKEYLRQRAVVFPKFKVGEMKRYSGVMTEEVARLMRAMGEEGEFDIAPSIGPTIMYIAAHAFLGRAFREKFSQKYFDMFREFSLGIEGLLPLWLHWLPLKHLRRGRAGKRFFRRELGSWIRERRARPVDPPDFFQEMLAAKYEDGTPVPDDVIFQLIMFMTWAGHETTTAQTTWALTDMLKSPEWFAKVRDEVDAVLGDTPPEAITWQQLGQLKIIDMVVRESERIHPIATFLQRVANEDIIVGGYRIPERDRVVIVPRLSHLDEREFPEAQQFRPDRFDPAGECPANMDSLIGFGGGLHRCLGVNFARLEMKTIIAMLVQRYELELLDPAVKVKGMTTPWPRSPCRLAWRRRAAQPKSAAAAPISKAAVDRCPVAH
ncbi:MAG TPA: cytochrome P450 [Alphaproteobacteria bacterium]|nr:cytochrome P450 [Alphaproteobacteria bacterium]